MSYLAGAPADGDDAGLRMPTMHGARPDPERFRHTTVIIAGVGDERIVGRMLGADSGKGNGWQVLQRLRRLVFPADISEQRAFRADHIEQRPNHRFRAANDPTNCRHAGVYHDDAARLHAKRAQIAGDRGAGYWLVVRKIGHKKSNIDPAMNGTIAIVLLR